MKVFFVKAISQAFTCTHQINDLMNSKNIWSSLDVQLMTN